MFKSFQAKLASMLTALTLAFVGTPAFAVIDVTGATAGISEGVVAVTAILVALIAAYGAFIGLRMAYRSVKRGG